MISKTNHSDATGFKTGSLHRIGTNKYILSVIYYDEEGRPDDIRETQIDGSLIVTQTQYGFTGNPLTETVTRTSGNETQSFEKSYSYSDYNGRLESITISPDGYTANSSASYEYDPLGRLEEENLGNNTIGYSYNLRGWTTAINNTAFKEWLHYTDGIGTHQYGGNISSQLWQVSGENFKRGYTFSYDGLGRMLKAEYGEGESLSSHKDRYSEWVMEYTKNNGIRKLERYGRKSDGNYGKIDNLRLYYTGMQVDSVKEDALPVTYAGAFDFKAKTISTDDVQYAYYADGSLKWDANKGVTLIEYDYFGYPKKICFSNGNTTEYVYTADGRKLRTIYKTAVPNVTVALGETISLTSANTLSVDTITYAGDFILENGQLAKYLFDKGYFTFSNGQAVVHYYIQDHQGNIRAVVDGDNHVEQINHYYPFGAVYSDAGNNDAFQRYKYNGKELDRMHGLNQYDYGARNYDPLLCRFTQIDPLCEKYYNFSPYGYCGNNPVNRIDPDGRSTWVVSQGDGTYRVIGGDLNDKDRNIYVYSKDKNGDYTVRGESIGISSSTTSFYNSDANDGVGAWAVNAIIDPSDNSGKNFLSKMMSENITLDEYMDKARNEHPYDFKVTNGGPSVVSKDNKYIYRGMSIGKTASGQMIYTSARDVGNIAAGAVAAKNGIPWHAARVAFDAYQGGRERISTQRAEYYGWSQVYTRSNGVTESVHMRNAINSFVRKLWTNIRK